jgi:hypothetical protein
MKKRIYKIYLIKHIVFLLLREITFALKASKAFKYHILTLPLRQILKAFHAKNKKYCDHRTR